MKDKSILLQVVSAGLLSLSSAFAFARLPPGPVTIVFPMVGIANGETLELNAVSSDPSCQVLLTIYDSNGTPVMVGTGTAGIGSGKVRHSPFQARQELRAKVILTPPAGSTLSCVGHASVEVYGDVLEPTSVIVPGLQPPPIPDQINPGPSQFGPVSFGYLQTVRLNVVAYPPSPCIGSLGFSDLRGNLLGVLGALTAVNLAPGQGTFIDLPGPSIMPTLGLQSVVFATFKPSEAAAPGTCLLSVEVYDELTQRTRAVLIPPEPTSLPPGPAG